MRPSEIEFFDKCTELKYYFQVSNFTMYAYEDGDYAEFFVSSSIDLRNLYDKAGGYDILICPSENKMRVRIFEKCYE